MTTVWIDCFLIPGFTYADHTDADFEERIRAAVKPPLVFGHVSKWKVYVESPEPDPNGDDWISFLHYLADSMVNAHDLVYCIEKPHKFAQEYAAYLAAGGVNREE